jgi:hypothetical protein
LSGRTAQEAARNFLTPLKAAVGCVTREGFVARGTRVAGQQQTAHFRDGFAILNRRHGQPVSLELYHRYVVHEVEGNRGPWNASTVEYVYEISDERDDLIAAWHWHPSTTQTDDQIRWPHVHAYGARDRLTLHKPHLPTSRISIEAVIRFLIQDLDVVPRRIDWDSTLIRNEKAFRRLRSWA